MSVSVVIPWQVGDKQRSANLVWLHTKIRSEFPTWKIVYGYDHLADFGRPFSRTRAIINGMSKTQATAVVISDADVWCSGLPAAVRAVLREGYGWAIPHSLVHRLSDESTARVLAGESWLGLPLSTDNAQDSRPYVGHEAGTLLVIARATFADAPPDPRFEGWGSEDQAWSDLLHVMHGAPWRGQADLFHLWHPAQTRLDRVVGTRDNALLAGKYRRARESRSAVRDMQELISQGVAFWKENVLL